MIGRSQQSIHAVLCFAYLIIKLVAVGQVHVNASVNRLQLYLQTYHLSGVFECNVDYLHQARVSTIEYCKQLPVQCKLLEIIKNCSRCLYSHLVLVHSL